VLAANCKIEKIHPAVFAFDAEVNIVTVTVLCPDGKSHFSKTMIFYLIIAYEFISLILSKDREIAFLQDD
jgi:hypothetical protein